MKTHCDPIKLTLAGLDSNAFALMGAWRKAAKQQARTSEEIKNVLDDCMSGDYNHLISTLANHSIDENEDGDDWDEEDLDELSEREACDLW